MSCKLMLVNNLCGLVILFPICYASWSYLLWISCIGVNTKLAEPSTELFYFYKKDFTKIYISWEASQK
jgi:hypothetical protein